jgi:hypothetical protein
MMLTDAHRQFLSDLDCGTTCPVCSRHAKANPYVISSTLAKLLRALINHDGWLRYRDFPRIATGKAPNGKAVSYYSILKFWGLLERHPEEALWRAPAKATEFVAGNLSVPRIVLVGLDNALAVSVETVTFEDCLQGLSTRKKCEMRSTGFTFPSVAEGITLQAAIEHHKVHRIEGTYCALCGRWNQVYPRAMNCEMASVLMRLFNESKARPGVYLHAYNDCQARGGDYAKLEFWGLIERHPTNDTWKITAKGELFASGAILVKSHVILLNDELLDFGGKDIDIRTALNTPFDGDSLMAAAA